MKKTIKKSKTKKSAGAKAKRKTKVAKPAKKRLSRKAKVEKKNFDDVTVQNSHTLTDLGNVPETNADQPAQDTGMIEKFESSAESSFFYTSDKIIDGSDDHLVIEQIEEKYPLFNDQQSDKMLRILLLQILNDEEFITAILKKYDLTVFEFFKILFKFYGSLFNSLFLTKLKDNMKNKKYATIRKHNYR